MGINGKYLDHALGTNIHTSGLVRTRVQHITEADERVHLLEIKCACYL